MSCRVVVPIAASVSVNNKVLFRTTGYYNKALILDPTTFAIVTQLPGIPGAVNDGTLSH